MKLPQIRLKLFMIGICILAFSAIIAVPTYSKIKASLDSKKWPTTAGMITESSIEKQWAGKKYSYRPRVKYTYSVHEKEYTGSSISFSDVGSKFESYAQEIIEKYSANSIHKVFYNPHEPSICALEPGVSWKTLLVGIIPIVFFIAGVLVLLASSKKLVTHFE